MRNHRYCYNILLAVVVFLVYLAMVLVKTFSPAAVLPHLSIPLVAAAVLAALLLEAYLAPKARRTLPERGIAALLAAATVALLPGMAGFVSGAAVGVLLAVGFVLCLVCDVLFASIRERLASGPATKAAPALSAALLFLAVQGFSGMIF